MFWHLSVCLSTGGQPWPGPARRGTPGRSRLGGLGGGYPGQVQMGRRVPHLARGYLRWGTPQQGWSTPPARSGWGVPEVRYHLAGMRYPPARLGWGGTWGGVPPSQVRQGGTQGGVPPAPARSGQGVPKVGYPPAGMGYPHVGMGCSPVQDSRWSTWYAAVGMPSCVHAGGIDAHYGCYFFQWSILNYGENDLVHHLTAEEKFNSKFLLSIVS